MSEEIRTEPSDLAPKDEAGEDMHIHKPKAAHSLREFLSEISVIVLGVLIALALEQAVEWLHWRHETDAAREALKTEAADNVAAAVFRQRQQGCIQRRLDELAVIFERHASSKPIALRGRVGRPVFYGATQNAWQVEVASQALAHMTLKEKLAFGAAFDNYVNLDQTLLREQEAWLRLGVLDNATVLQEGDWPVLHQAYAEARSLNTRIEIITTYVLSAESLGTRPTAVPMAEGVKVALDEICSPILQLGT